MIRKPLCLFTAGFLAFSPPLRAQEAPPATGETTGEASKKPGDTLGPNRFWQATVGDGHFMVALDRIVSVSRHQYAMDGGLIVDEVTVDTVGQALTRFYFIAPISEIAPGNTAANLAERGRELIDKAAERTGTRVQDMVVKKYPDTTHAKSIEYRVASQAELKSLYGSLKTAWESGRGRQFTAR
jgi:hypothetical protein